MQTKRRLLLWFLALLVSAVLATGSAQAQNYIETVLYSFKGGTDGASPEAAVVQDAQGISILDCGMCCLAADWLGDLLADKLHRGSTTFATPYQAVLLNNGAVYYGNLAGYGTRHPMLTDVF